VNQEVGMKLPKGMYLWYNDNAMPGENGVKSFPNLGIGKAWGNNSVDTSQKRLKFSDQTPEQNSVEKLQIIPPLLGL
jgi:hypothetical protein